MMRRLALGMVAVLGLSACSSWMGDNAAPPLPGKRISVLSREKALEPEVKDAEIKLPPPEPNSEWPQAGGFANHAMHHMEVGDRLERQWRTGIGEGAGKRARLLAQPVVAEGLAFTMDAEASVRAINANTGDVVWDLDLTPDDEDSTFASGGVAYEDGLLFATTGFAQVVAIEAKTGKVVWRQSLSGPMRGAPTVRAGRVFVVTVDNQTHCLAAEDGAVLWTHQGISEGASLLAGTSPAVDGNVVVVPYSSGELFALRIDNGSVLWQDQLTTLRRTDNVATLSDIRGRPIIDRGRVYAIGHADMLVAIDLRTGRRLWEREVGGIQSPWVAGDYLFLVTNSNEALAVEAKTGRLLWVTQLRIWEDEEDKEGRVIWAGPVLASDRLIVGSSDGYLVALSPYTGEVLGKVSVSDGVTIQPAVANGTLYFVTNDADLVAYR
ncbi:PQQ-binding-like beta-propeller repeat protein [Magnetospirillum aberrantis]|uniref:PQQ-binding-like beta-propeller repeat protein n=1 Tax=Magnetospirillum aberrantis SpK TaxID=908842 RepID=A0A7C9UZ35_9PROT|nr:PQQ-binding-like beta-propeller repeat protein [Magnetospirillum aberrantis]NFV80233.1 PQQ-binding-like beta-propeller repeat protein [Magnetospirillum aberrantis SpK]